MAYLDQALLVGDSRFRARVSACVTEQSGVFQNDARPDLKALALDVLRVTASAQLESFYQLTATAPGLADTAAMPDGSVDSSLITDADLLAAVQANYPTVAALFYDADGAPVT